MFPKNQNTNQKLMLCLAFGFHTFTQYNKVYAGFELNEEDNEVSSIFFYTKLTKNSVNKTVVL